MRSTSSTLNGYQHGGKFDVWIEMSPENAARICRALEEFGFGELGLRSQDFLEPDQVIQLGDPPNQIDLITSLTGVTFDRCYRSRLEITVDGVTFALIDQDNLKKNKMATGRTQDIADVEGMENP